MSTDQDRIRANIEQTQDDLGRNVDALGDRVNPRRVAQHQTERARGTWQKVKENVMGSTEQVRDASLHARDASMHARDVGQERLSGLSTAASERMHGMGQSAQQQTQGHPLAAGLVAFGLGILASSLLPTSQPERQMAGQLRHKASEHAGDLKQQAMGAARQTQDSLREPAQHAAESVKSKAGQGAGALRDQAQSTGQGLRGQAEKTAKDVRQQ
ncbi:uncharacterized protein DUF3618 [Micromonospora pisi]|uniref:Uncharacterized protein DUF3618 n=1 Tax=Micromonospora pisi TaxID=589240 RepID=A0A495JN06_9ACTN|nr:DUF3618 domain-containing protein [Micromonospora pisi]RKR90293.1 uncharacterized protein DUF3618 [Micromonospora pisi]